MGLPISVVPYDDAKHHNFVFDAVRARARDWPYCSGDTNWLVEQVRRTVVANPRGCAVAVADDDPDLFYGFVVADVGEVVMAYTKDALRGPGNFDAPIGTKRAFPGVCTALLAAVGIDLEKPTAVRIWSKAASRIAARGYRVYPAIPK